MRMENRRRRKRKKKKNKNKMKMLIKGEKKVGGESYKAQ